LTFCTIWSVVFYASGAASAIITEEVFKLNEDSTPTPLNNLKESNEHPWVKLRYEFSHHYHENHH
jgi:hypothetical protein